MKTLLNHKKIGEVSYTSKCGLVTWFYPVLLYIGVYNPFNPVGLVRPWCSTIPAGGFHFLFIRVAWTNGAEIESKRIARLEPCKQR